MTGYRNRLILLVLQNAPLILFVLLLVIFGMMSARFLTPLNFVNILIQSSHIAIIGIGMTFVLLIAGIDLSVGANMYLSAAVLGVLFKSLPPAQRKQTRTIGHFYFGVFLAKKLTEFPHGRHTF